MCRIVDRMMAEDSGCFLVRMGEAIVRHPGLTRAVLIAISAVWVVLKIAT